MTDSKPAFYTSFILSGVIHMLVFVVLFAAPVGEPEPEFSELKIRLGIKNHELAQPQKQQPQQKQIAQDGSIDGNANINTTPQAAEKTRELNSDLAEAISKTDKPADKQVATNKPDNDIQPSKKPIEKIADNNLESQQEQKMRRVVEQVARQMTIPEAAEEILTPAKKSQNKQEGGNGAKAGNSSEDDAAQLMTYEQMLPLWLEQFKKYPEKARLMKLEGDGIIRITIKRDGTVLRKEIEVSTGHPILDRSLIDMVVKANPVIPVPPDHLPDMKALSYRIKFQFRYN